MNPFIQKSAKHNLPKKLQPPKVATNSLYEILLKESQTQHITISVPQTYPKTPLEGFTKAQTSIGFANIVEPSLIGLWFWRDGTCYVAGPWAESQTNNVLVMAKHMQASGQLKFQKVDKWPMELVSYKDSSQ